MAARTVVRRVQGAKPKAVKRKARKSRGKKRSPGASARPSAVDVAEMQLPTETRPVSEEIKDYSILLYAPPKWGKSTMLSTFPNVLFLATEPGIKGLEVYSFGTAVTDHLVTDWRMMRRAVELLEKGDEFENVAVDTAMLAYAMCSKWVCQQRGIEHPSDVKDFGKTWNAVADEFLDVLHRITRSGRGLYLTAHSRESKVESASGKDYSRIDPKLTGQASGVILGFVDLILYGEFIGGLGAGMRRVLITEGDDLIMAGSRKLGMKTRLPEMIAMPEDEDEDYSMLAAAFRGEVDGVDPAMLTANAHTSKAAEASLRKRRAASAAARLQRGKEGNGKA